MGLLALLPPSCLLLPRCVEWYGDVLAVNYLLIENLQRLDFFYRDTLKVECPTGSGHFVRLRDVASDLSARLSRLFLPDPYGSRACHGECLTLSVRPLRQPGLSR